MIEPAEKIALLYEHYLACGSCVSTDSRRVTPGSLFFALHGASFDGNRFAAAALEAGAAAAVVDDPVAAVDPRYILAHNTLTALQQLGAHHRQVLGLPVLAITGTNGKTTTKELVARVLARQFRITVTAGNLNNHIGVPLTLLSIHADAEMAVVEMGAGAPGEIAALCRIAQPNYGLITNIGMAHLEGFRDFEGVRRGKGELYDFLDANGGVAFYRQEDPVLAGMASEREGLNAVPYSELGGEIPSHLEGDYNLYNIAAAVAVGQYFEVSQDDILDAVAGYVPDNNRSQAVETACNRLLVDCYNANPSSMRAALENFSRGGKAVAADKVTILGDMFELGDAAAAEHAAIVKFAACAGLGQVIFAGENFAQASAATVIPDFAPLVFPTTAELIAYLRQNPFSGKHILIKGSRGMRLESITGLL